MTAPLTITARQRELLRAIQQEPRERRTLCEEYPDALEAPERDLAQLESEGLIELTGRRLRLTRAGADWLAAQPRLTPPRTFANATMREPLRAKPWTSVRPGADHHLQFRSLCE